MFQSRGGLLCLNLLRPRDAYMRQLYNHHWFRQWLVAWSAPSHYLNRCWHIVNWTLWHTFWWHPPEQPSLSHRAPRVHKLGIIQSWPTLIGQTVTGEIITSEYFRKCFNQGVVCCVLTHWGRETHICVSNLTIIGSDNTLSPGRRQAIIWNDAGILLIGPLGTNVNETSIEIHTFSFKKIHVKLLSGKWRPFCLGLNVLIYLGPKG